MKSIRISDSESRIKAAPWVMAGGALTLVAGSFLVGNVHALASVKAGAPRWVADVACAIVPLAGLMFLFAGYGLRRTAKDELAAEAAGGALVSVSNAYVAAFIACFTAISGCFTAIIFHAGNDKCRVPAVAFGLFTFVLAVISLRMIHRVTSPRVRLTWETRPNGRRTVSLRFFGVPVPVHAVRIEAVLSRASRAGKMTAASDVATVVLFEGLANDGRCDGIAIDAPRFFRERKTRTSRESDRRMLLIRAKTPFHFADVNVRFPW